MKLMTLREARKKTGITQAELARRTGIVQPAISDYEAMKSVPSDFFDCLKIEKALDAVGMIQWETSPIPDELVSLILKAIANTRCPCAANSSIRSSQ